MIPFGNGVEIHATLADRYNTILTPEALEFAVSLQREFAIRLKYFHESCDLGVNHLRCGMWMNHLRTVISTGA